MTFLDYAAGLGLCEVAFYDASDTESNPMDEALITNLEGLIDRTLLRVADVPNGATLKRRGEALRRRLHEVGSQQEPILILVGKK